MACLPGPDVIEQAAAEAIEQLGEQCQPGASGEVCETPSSPMATLVCASSEL